MIERFGVITVGQCGANFGKEFEELGFLVHYINTSDEDLNTIQSPNKYHVRGAEGCYHNRDKAKEYCKKNCGELLESCINVLSKQVILVVFSAGGGTGSGMGPMLVDILRVSFVDKIICPVMVMPDDRESIRVLQNAHNCLVELSKIKGKGCTFLLDNNKRDKYLINKEFVRLFIEFISLKTNLDSRGNLDSGEVIEMLGVRGNAIICKSKSDSMYYPSVIESIKNNVFVDVEGDKKIVYIGMSVPYECEDGIEYIKEYVGEWYDRYKTYNNKKENLVGLFGLSFPSSRLDVIKDKIHSYKQYVVDSINSSSDGELDCKIDEVKIQSKVQVKEVDFKDIFSKY